MAKDFFYVKGDVQGAEDFLVRFSCLVVDGLLYDGGLDRFWEAGKLEKHTLRHSNTSKMV